MTTIARIDAFALVAPEPHYRGAERCITLARVEARDGAVGWGEAISQLRAATKATKLLIDEAFACAKQLASLPTRGLGLTKRAFNRSLGVDLAAQLEYEEEVQREAGRTADYAEGVKAFLEKRKPVFTGQ